MNQGLQGLASCDEKQTRLPLKKLSVGMVPLTHARRRYRRCLVG